MTIAAVQSRELQKGKAAVWDRCQLDWSVATVPSPQERHSPRHCHQDSSHARELDRRNAAPSHPCPPSDESDVVLRNCAKRDMRDPLDDNNLQGRQ